MAESSQTGLAPLLETVDAEARQQRESQLDAARQRAALRLAEAERNAAEIEAKARAAGVAEGEREAQSRIARARIETRRDLLRAREAQIERAIEIATHRLDEQLRGVEGAALVATALRAAAQVLGESRLHVRAAHVDHAAVAAALGTGAPAIEWEPDAGAETSGVLVFSADRHRMVDMTLTGVAHRRHEAARRAAAEALVGGKRGDP